MLSSEDEIHAVTQADALGEAQAHDRLRLAACLFEQAQEGVIITDARSRIVDVNLAFERITGYSREEALGQRPAMLSSGRHDRRFYAEMWRSLHEHGCWSGEIWNRRKDGELCLELLRLSAVKAGDERVTHYVGTFSDITGARRQQHLIERLAHYDPLTSLPNRALMRDRLGQMVAHAERCGAGVYVCSLDLDGFNSVNERLGHEAGDELLVQAAERLQAALPAGDTAARLGGDEFVLLIGDGKPPGQARATLAQAAAALARPYLLRGEPVHLGASVGVAAFARDATSPDQLLRLADQAMFRAKRLGRARIVFAESDSDDTQRPAQLAELREAIAHGQLELHFQAQVDAISGQPLGAEALLRWRHPQRGVLSPGEFLPWVAGTPLELELDLHVLRAGIGQLAHWRARGWALGLSINLSPGTLIHPGLAEHLGALFRQCSLPADSGLELEVVESAALADIDAATHVMRACSALGIRFALDDFGTGYSSLSYLRRLPVSTLKIDQSFVRRMLADAGDMHIVRAVIGLAKAFGVNTVAEGVETEAHVQALRDLGCEQLQGYGVARPLPVAAFEQWLCEQHGFAAA